MNDKIDKMLDRAVDKNGTLMIAKFIPEQNVFAWIKLSDEIAKLIKETLQECIRETPEWTDASNNNWISPNIALTKLDELLK